MVTEYISHCSQISSAAQDPTSTADAADIHIAVLLDMQPRTAHLHIVIALDTPIQHSSGDLIVST